MKELPKPEVKIPEWFTDHNIILHGEGDLDPESRTSVDYFVDRDYSKRLRKLVQDGPDDSGEAPEAMKDPTRESSQRTDSAQLGEPSPLRFKRRRTPREEPRYWLDAIQHVETMMTTSGLMSPHQRPEHENEPANKTSHLLLHSAAKDGELLLEEYVRNIAFELGSDLMALDVQDIADIVATSHQPPDVVSKARHMSYDVSRRTADWSLENSGGSPFMEEHDVDEEMDDEDSVEDSPSRGSSGLPMMIGKPITIDLSNMFGERERQRRDRSSSAFERLFAPAPDGAKPNQPPTSTMTDLVERLLAAVTEKRSRTKTCQQSSEQQVSPSEPSGARILLHVKDIRAIQDTAVGGDLLSELYTQVQKKRNSGERIMIIGTQCVQGDAPSPSGIEQLQKLQSHDISRTIVLTPATTSTTARLNLAQDRKVRIATINLRHIYGMVKLKPITSKWFDLAPGFWKSDTWLGKTKHFWASTDLGKNVLSFSDVHRVSTMLAGLSNAPNDLSASLGLEDRSQDFALDMVQMILRESDNSKARWAKQQTSNKQSRAIDMEPEDSHIVKIPGVRYKAREEAAERCHRALENQHHVQ